MQTTTGFPRLAIVFAGLSGAAGVAIGAWASHAGTAAVGPEAIRLVEIGIRYQLVHALGLLGVLALGGLWPGRFLRYAVLLFGAGTVLFCGSLYLLAATGLGAFGMATPFGGLCFIAGWLMLPFHALWARR